MLFGMVTKQQQDGSLHLRSSCAVVWWTWRTKRQICYKASWSEGL